MMMYVLNWLFLYTIFFNFVQFSISQKIFSGLDALYDQCGDPIDLLLTKLDGKGSVISIFSEVPETVANIATRLKLKLTTEDDDEQTPPPSFSIGFHIYSDNSSTLQNKYMDPSSVDNYEQNFVIMIPHTEKTALDMLDNIGLTDETNLGRPKVGHYVIWPTNCWTVNCLQDTIESWTFYSLPPLSTDTFIFHCNNGSHNNNSSEQMWDLYSIYAVGRENLTQLEPLSGLDDLHDSYHKKGNFRGATIRASVPVSSNIPKEEISFENKNQTVTLTTGMTSDVTLYLRDSLKFSLDLQLEDGRLSKMDNGQWNEMGMKLLKDQVDISLVKVTLVPSRQESFTFLMPNFVEGVQAYFRQPPASYIRNIFIEPFTKGVWATLIVVWFLVGLSTIMAAHIKSRHEQLLEEDEEISKNSILWAVALTCQQGWHLDPQSISMKVIFFSGSLMGLIVYVAFSAKLVSSLSTVVIPIKKLDDLLQSDFSISLQPNSQTLKYILTDEEFGYGIHQTNLLRKRERSIRSREEGVDLVLKERSAYLCFSDDFYITAKGPSNQTDRELCEKISSVPFSKVPFRSGMLVGKNSKYKEYFNHRMVCMYENGLMRRIQTNYINSFRGECDRQRRKKGHGLGLNDLASAYLIILGGYALSFTIFLIELLYYKHTQRMLAQEVMDQQVEQH